MKKIHEVVANVAIDELPSQQASCPFCGSTDLIENGRQTTLVGGDPHPDKDCNHVWEAKFCNKCFHTFERECKSGNVWYTDSHKVIKGLPNCFEKYIYDCRCGAKHSITKETTKLDGVTPETWLMSTTEEIGEFVHNKPQYRIFMKCDSCGLREESSEEYPGMELYWKRPKSSGKLRPGWVVYEEVGICLINDYGIAKVNIDPECPKPEVSDS